MKMHYLLKSALLVFVLATSSPSMASSLGRHPYTEDTKSAATQLMNRLEEIKAMDKSELTTSEKKALRKEVKTIKKEMATMAGGIYLSIGAAILIVLLLILLL
jgi:hypothetical protein